MKQTIKYMCIAFGILVSANANSQEYKTDESVSSQLKNNKVPQAKYGTEVSVARKADTPPAQQNVGKAIKEGRLAGMKPASGQSLSTGSPAKTTDGVAATLPSEVSAEDRKKELEEAKKRVKVVVPVEQVVEKK